MTITPNEPFDDPEVVPPGDPASVPIPVEPGEDPGVPPDEQQPEIQPL